MHFVVLHTPSAKLLIEALKFRRPGRLPQQCPWIDRRFHDWPIFVQVTISSVIEECDKLVVLFVRDRVIRWL